MGRPKGKKSKPKVSPAPVIDVDDDDAVEAHVEIASTTAVTNLSQKALLDQIASLRAERKALKLEVKKSQQEIEALEAAQSEGQVFGSAATEKATGKTVTVRRLKRYKVVGYENGREVLRPIFHNVEKETYFYKIDMPPCGDIALKINEIPFYHGGVYEVDIDVLRTLKDIVARTWDHDRSIHPTDENFYRRDPGWQARNSKAINRGMF